MPVIYFNLYFNPRTYKQIHTPIVVQGGRGGGGLMEPLTWPVFAVFLYFGKKLPLRWLETVLLGARRLGSNLPVRLKKGTNKNGVALSSGFNILRRSFKSCV